MPPSSEALFLISLRGMLRRLEILEVQARIRTAEGNNSLETCAVQLASARAALAGALRSFNRRGRIREHLRWAAIHSVAPSTLRQAVRPRMAFTSVAIGDRLARKIRPS